MFGPLIAAVTAASMLADEQKPFEGRAEIAGQPARLAHMCAFETEDPVRAGSRLFVVLAPSEEPPQGMSCREVWSWMKRREYRDAYTGLRADIQVPPSGRGEYRWGEGELLHGGKSHGLSSFFGTTLFQRNPEESRETLAGRLWTAKPLVAGEFPTFFVDVNFRIPLERLPPASQHLRGLRAAGHPAAAVVKLSMLAMSVGNMRGVRSHILQDAESLQAFDRKQELMKNDPSRKYLPLIGGVGLMMPVKAVVDLGGLTRVTLGPPGRENSEDVHILLRKVQGKWRLIDF